MEQLQQRRLHASVLLLSSIQDMACLTSRSNPSRLSFVKVILWSNEKYGCGEKKDGCDFQNTKKNDLSSAGMVDQKTLWDSYDLDSVFRPFFTILLDPTCSRRCFID